MERPVIEIDEELCNGCGKCILDCAEGALAIVEGKAKLISDVYCDGLGACLNCPRGALALRTREAAPFDEAAALSAKLARESAEHTRIADCAPKSAVREILAISSREEHLEKKLETRLRCWPIQLELMPPRADYYRDAEILLAAQCSGFALPRMAEDWIAGRLPIIACPKLENHVTLAERLGAILRENSISKITVLRMSVPCCGLEKIVRDALASTARDVPWETYVARI